MLCSTLHEMYGKIYNTRTNNATYRCVLRERRNDIYDTVLTGPNEINSTARRKRNLNLNQNNITRRQYENIISDVQAEHHHPIPNGLIVGELVFPPLAPN
uniref:Uncharacterized protein n=1 Tax=Sipha flava TaxID=143950 RepID=A0A2S2QH18_9HEMI